MALFKLFKISFLPLISFCLPVWGFPLLVSAEVSIKRIFEKGTDIVDIAINFFVVLAAAVFIWGIVKFIAAAGNSEKLKEAKHLIIWGLVGIFVLLSFMGIIEILQNTIFDGAPPTDIPLPSMPTFSGS
jgi:hypothetical protein